MVCRGIVLENWGQSRWEHKVGSDKHIEKKKIIFTMIEKMRAVYLIELYGDQGKKYLEVPWLVQKCGTKYQKE